jgi:hypothetical protein
MCYTFSRQCKFCFTSLGNKAFTQKGLKVTCPVLAFLPKCLKEKISIVKFKAKCMVFHALMNDFLYTVSIFNKNILLISTSYNCFYLHAFCFIKSGPLEKFVKKSNFYGIVFGKIFLIKESL